MHHVKTQEKIKKNGKYNPWGKNAYINRILILDSCITEEQNLLQRLGNTIYFTCYLIPKVTRAM